jgi:hypothetical protein
LAVIFRTGRYGEAVAGINTAVDASIHISDYYASTFRLKFFHFAVKSAGLTSFTKVFLNIPLFGFTFVVKALWNLRTRRALQGPGF